MTLTVTVVPFIYSILFMIIISLCIFLILFPIYIVFVLYRTGPEGHEVLGQAGLSAAGLLQKRIPDYLKLHLIAVT